MTNNEKAPELQGSRGATQGANSAHSTTTTTRLEADLIYALSHLVHLLQDLRRLRDDLAADREAYRALFVETVRALDGDRKAEALLLAVEESRRRAEHKIRRRWS